MEESNQLHKESRTEFLDLNTKQKELSIFPSPWKYYIKLRLPSLVSLLKSSSQDLRLPCISLMYNGWNGHVLAKNYKAPQFVYGEFSSLSQYIEILNSCNRLKPDCKFVDLGSGLGKVNLLVALHYNIKESLGIELVHRLNRVSDAHGWIYNNFLKQFFNRQSKVEFKHADILKSFKDWKDADVVFMNSITWKAKMMKKLTYLLEQLKEGSEVIATTALPTKTLKLYKTIEVNADWGNCKAYFYTKSC